MKPTVVAPQNLVLRVVPPDKLNAEIANRAVDGEGRDPRALMMIGVEFLQRGNQEQAVALFQGAFAISASSWVRNCLAFCQLPADPAGAAEVFRELLAEEFDPPLLHANLAATCRLLKDVTAAHQHARTGLDLLHDRDDRTAHLWGFDKGVPTLMSDISLRDYLTLVLSWE